MNSRFLTIFSVVAVAFALVFGFGTIDTAKAVPGMNGDGYAVPAGDANLFGLDSADILVNGIHRDSDIGGKFAPGPYGLRGKSQL